MRWHDLRHVYATLLRDSAVNMKAISEYLFVDRSNLMRELKKMEEKGIIERNNKIIIIKDSQKLM